MNEENEIENETETKPKTKKQLAAEEFQARGKKSNSKASREHWLRRWAEKMGFNTSASRKARWTVTHETNRHERRKKAAEKRRELKRGKDGRNNRSDQNLE